MCEYRIWQDDPQGASYQAPSGSNSWNCSGAPLTLFPLPLPSFTHYLWPRQIHGPGRRISMEPGLARRIWGACG